MMLRHGFQVKQTQGLSLILVLPCFLLAVYLGVNNMKVDYLNKALKGQKQYEYGVEWGLAHPQYFTHKVCSHFGLLLIIFKEINDINDMINDFCL